MAAWSPRRDGPLHVDKADVKEQGEHCYAAAFSQDGKYLAVAYGSGTLRVLDAKTMKPLARARPGKGFDDLPCTNLKWRPPHEDVDDGFYEIGAVTTAGGVLGFVFDPTDPAAAFLDRKWRVEEKGSETAACDFSPDGQFLLTAGSDRTVRCYDASTHKLTQTLDRGFDDQGHTRAAHTNRIFSIRFVGPHFFFTGGWENPVQVWDFRTGKAERQIVGPSVSSDAIEVFPGQQTVTIVSKRDTKQIQVFDYLSGRELEEEGAKLSQNVGRCHVTSARYSMDQRLLWAAATKNDVIFCIDAATGALRGVVEGLGPILCLAADPSNPRRCIAGGMKESIFMLELVD